MLRLANLIAVIHFNNFIRFRWVDNRIASSIASTLNKRVRSWCKTNVVYKANYPLTLAIEVDFGNVPIACCQIQGQIFKLHPDIKLKACCIGIKFRNSI